MVKTFYTQLKEERDANESLNFLNKGSSENGRDNGTGIFGEMRANIGCWRGL